MKNTYKTSEATNREEQIVFGGLLAICVAATLTCLSLPSLDKPLNVSVYAFAIAIPLLSFSIYTITIEMKHRSTIEPKYRVSANLIGIGSALVGTTAVFWHFSWIVGLIFLAVSTLSFVFVWWFDDELKNANKQNSVQPKKSKGGMP